VAYLNYKELQNKDLSQKKNNGTEGKQRDYYPLLYAMQDCDNGQVSSVFLSWCHSL